LLFLEVVMRFSILMLILRFFVGSLQAQFIPEKSFTLPEGTLGNHFLAKGDFNRDGELDVLFPGTNASAEQELVVFPGNGTGGFGAPIVTPITGLDRVQIEAAGDLNGDGIPDAVITGTDPIQGIAEIGVMLADGTGKFKAPVFTRSTLTGLMVLGDFTGDGKVDLAVLGGYSLVTVFPGKGDGTLGSAVTSTFEEVAACTTTGDFNKDGKLDLITGNDLLLGNGDGTFQNPRSIDVGCDIAVADFNKDGIPDIVAGGTVYPYQTRIFLGDGTGKFTNVGAYLGYHSGYASGRGLTIARFNGDTNFDIAVSNTLYNDVTILLGNGDGTFTVGKSFVVSILGLLSGDFSGDGKIDLAVQAQSGFSLLLGTGNGTFNALPTQEGQLGTAIRLADFDGDGKVDAVEFIGPSKSGSAVLLGNGDGSFGAPIPLACQASIGVVGDFNGDKKPDIAISPGSGIEICLNNGNGTFTPGGIVDAGVQHGQLVIGDFNHDGKLDLAATDVGGVSILLGNGDGTFKDAIPTGASNFVNTVTGDFNHDGKLDIASNSNGEITVLLGKGDGTFQAPLTSPNANGIGAVAAGDLNSDGILDLVSIGSNGMNILLGKGDGTFEAPTLVKVVHPTSFQIRDVNADGKLDLIVAGPSYLDVILGTGKGTFQAPKIFPAPRGTSSFAVADLNGDGLLDVAFLDRVGNAKFGTLTVYLNQGH
jgi:hypothetical protein